MTIFTIIYKICILNNYFTNHYEKYFSSNIILPFTFSLNTWSQLQDLGSLASYSLVPLRSNESTRLFAFQNANAITLEVGENVTVTSNRLVNRIVSRSRLTVNRSSSQCRSLSMLVAMLMATAYPKYCRLLKPFQFVRWRLIRRHAIAACILAIIIKGRTSDTVENVT